MARADRADAYKQLSLKTEDAFAGVVTLRNPFGDGFYGFFFEDPAFWVDGSSLAVQLFPEDYSPSCVSRAQDSARGSFRRFRELLGRRKLRLQSSATRFTFG